MMDKLSRRALFTMGLFAYNATLTPSVAHEWTEADIERARDRGVFFRCWVDGLEYDRVLRACPERGFIEVAARHRLTGGYYVGLDGECARDVIYGSVKVKPIPSDQA